jgi:hypothetical protein
MERTARTDLSRDALTSTSQRITSIIVPKSSIVGISLLIIQGRGWAHEIVTTICKRSATAAHDIAEDWLAGRKCV